LSVINLTSLVERRRICSAFKALATALVVSKEESSRTAVRAAVRLHLAETHLVIGRLAAFQVSINGTQILTFNIFVAAGKKNKGVIKQFTINTSSMLM
jgi:hypothetical protein